MPPKTTKRKTKTGCVTCKARKVKCDELKPVCGRCRSTGRVCDGYGIWGGGGNGYAERYRTILKSHQLPPPIPHLISDLSHREGQHMQWLQYKMTKSSAYSFSAGFWAELIFPATWREPAITHAVIALSSAHRNDLRRRRGLMEAQEEEFTLMQYTKAIRYLQQLMSRRDSASIPVVLVTCLLFICLEYTRGQHNNAATHLKNGLNVLRHTHLDCANSVHGILMIKPPYKHSIDRAILQGFATLHVQSSLFSNQVSEVALILQATDSEVPLLPFVSLEEARDSLLKLLHGMLLLSQQTAAAIASARPRQSLMEAQRIASQYLVAWHNAFELMTRSLEAQSKRNSFPNILLLNYHTMASIMCGCMQSASQSIYNNYTKDFIAIIRRFIELWKYYASEESGERNVFFADVGWIPPLYYTAMKCRDHRIRLHAIRLLRSLPQKEGLWDSNLAACIAEHVMQLEEHVSNGHVPLESEFALDEVPCPVEVSPPSDKILYHEVQIDLRENGSVIATCKRQEVHHGIVILRFEFDGKTWHNIADPILRHKDSIQQLISIPTDPHGQL